MKYFNFGEKLLIRTAHHACPLRGAKKGISSWPTGSGSISAFALLAAILVGICSAVGIKLCAIIARIKKYKSIVKKKKKMKHDKKVLLGISKLNTIEVLISKSLIDSYISHDEFVSVNNVLREYYEMKKEIKNPETSVEYAI